MSYINRKILSAINHALGRGKSVLLLGARQTGKTTLIHEQIKPDIYYSFIQPATRQAYEMKPDLLGAEIEAELKSRKLKNPIVAIDEVQKIPLIMDVIQDLIDRRIARFIITGSSARKLKYGAHINLLPGRVLLFHLDPLMINEFDHPLPSLQTLLLYGSLPGIFLDSSEQDKNIDLSSYVKTYIEEEVRAEALVRNVGNFAKFIFLAAVESGNMVNYSKLSQDIGIAHGTIAAYYQILEDCLIAERIDPLTLSKTRKRLSKASKYLFFDLGVRRLCAEEGSQLPLKTMASLFEQFIGLELIRLARLRMTQAKILYWRDHSGPEVDYVIQQEEKLIPIEVKWNERPSEKDARHLALFLEEYQPAAQGYIVCQTPRRYLLASNIMVIPWQEIDSVFE